MNEQELTKKLTAPFEAKDVEWRIQQTTQDKSRGLAVAFITSRAIQKRLDETVGPFHWKTEFSPWHQIVNKGSQLCALSIYDEKPGTRSAMAPSFAPSPSTMRSARSGSPKPTGPRTATSSR